MLKFHCECIPCLIRSAVNKISAVTEPELRIEYMRGVCRILADIDPEHDSAPLADARITALRRDMLGIEEDYSAIKRDFNAMLLSMEEELRGRIERAEDPLYAAVQLCAAGNYIDFGVLDGVERETVLKLLIESEKYRPDRRTYDRMCDALRRGSTCAVLHDNCGEIVLDKLLIEQIRKKYPQISVCGIVRGSSVLNDVTLEDARQVGLDRVCRVVSNGVRGVPGTQMDMLPEDIRHLLEEADVVISKGQGNFETLIDSDLNVFYLLLAKCEHYATWFGLERFSCVLKAGRDLRGR